MPSRRPWAYERGALWTLATEHQSLLPVQPRVAATYAEVSQEGAETLAVAMELQDRAVVLRRFIIGSRCFAAWLAGSIVAYGWVSRTVEQIGELERPFYMQQGEAYIWDCATLKDYRRHGLYGSLLYHIAATLQSEGTGRLWIGASLYNRASVRGIRTLGFQPVVRMTYLRLLSLRHVWLRDYPGASHDVVCRARRGLIAHGEVKAVT